jgi:hypothetical protein
MSPRYYSLITEMRRLLKLKHQKEKNNSTMIRPK